jgi:hypothetical protein
MSKYQQEFNRIQEELTKEYDLRVEKEMDCIAKDCITFMQIYKLGMHDCKERTNQTYHRKALSILARIYGVVDITVITEQCFGSMGSGYGGFISTSDFVVFGPKISDEIVRLQQEIERLKAR